MTIEFDAQHAREFLVSVYGGKPGLVSIVSSANWRGEFFRTTEDGLSAAVEYAEAVDRTERPQGIYVRATTLIGRPAGRGGVADTACVPYFWADVDYGTDGHRDVNLPPREADAIQVVAESGLPEPTLLVHSGGGIYPLWLLDPLPDISTAVALSRGVQKTIEGTSARLGWSYGSGVGDLSRLLRLAGSLNLKLPDEPRPCYVGVASGTYVDPSWFPYPLPDRRPPSRPRSESNDGGRQRDGRGKGVFDALADTASWADILEPASWSYVKTESGGAELWLRPGDPASEYSARCFAHNLVCHSESAGLPSGAGRRLTKARVYAHLWHDGNESAAALDLMAAGRGGPCSEAAAALPQEVLEAIRKTASTEAERWAQLGLDVTELETRAGNDRAVATDAELASWLDSFTAENDPGRLMRRLAWMRIDSPRRLPRHALHLVAEAIAGDYSSEHAVMALGAAYRHHHSGAGPAPRALLAAALGAILRAKAGAA